MSRWPTGGQDRLQRAAIELFAERGYDRVAVAEIAVRAGLTERSFYNHFADKREALFPGQDRFIAELVEAIGTAPADLAPLDAVTEALAANTDWFDQRRDAAALRRRIIDDHTELREREAAKTAALTTAVAEALRARGSSGVPAALTAAVASTAFQLATAAWLADPEQRPLGWHLRRTVDELRRTAHDW